MKRRSTKQLRDFAKDREGTSAVEFAVVLPFLMIAVFGAYQINEAVSAYNKVTLTAHTVADLTTQYTSMAQLDVATVLNASAQIMTPFSTQNLVIVLTEYATSITGTTTVTWSASLSNGTVSTTQSSTQPVTLPANVAQPGTSLILATVSYKFKPPILYQLTNPYTMSSSIYMSPRAIASIPLSSS